MKSTQASFNTRSNIRIARFLAFEDNASLRGHNIVREANVATQPIVGISAQWPDSPQLPEVNTAILANGGTPEAMAAMGTADDTRSVSHHPENTQCGLLLAAPCNPGDLLTSNADGEGVVAGAAQYYGARALEAGVAGQLVDVEVIFGVTPA